MSYHRTLDLAFFATGQQVTRGLRAGFADTVTIDAPELIPSGATVNPCDWLMVEREGEPGLTDDMHWRAEDLAGRSMTPFEAKRFLAQRQQG